jgi:hypothetical protein
LKPLLEGHEVRLRGLHFRSSFRTKLSNTEEDTIEGKSPEGDFVSLQARIHSPALTRNSHQTLKSKVESHEEEQILRWRSG